jgi:hypothetical protein
MKTLSVVPTFVVVFACLALAAGAQDTVSVPVDTGYVEYHESPISLPLGVGLRVPSYDRVNGLTLPWGPKLEMGDGRVDVDALVRYRSNLGNWDPSLEGALRPSDQSEITFFGGIGTFTNDEWIRSDLTNSIVAFFAGTDARNYFRGTRGWARFTQTIMGSSTSLTPFLGINFERDWATGSVAPDKSPWSVFGRKSDQKMRRPNPPVDKGNIASALAGSGFEFSTGGVEGKLNLTVERSLHTAFEDECPTLILCFPPGDSFTQGTFDGRVMIPTFGAQTLTVRAHTMMTGGPGFAPRQRFAYLGGTGTLATVNLLALGGDQLFYIEGNYMIPIERIQLPIIGSPFVALRYAAGNAGIDKIPTLIQNIGIGAGVSMLRVDFSIDPAHDRSIFSRRSAVSVGLDLSF